MDRRLSVSVPSLLLSCGSGPETFCSFSDGCICEVSGRYLRLTNSQGATEYIPLHQNPDVAAFPEDAYISGYTACASHDRERLLAVGASGFEGEIQLLQLSSPQPKSLRRQRLSATHPMQILALDFSSCGLHLFCLSRGFQQQGQDQQQTAVHHITVLNVSDENVLICKLLQWDDTLSLPSRLLASAGGVAAVLSEKNMMLLKLRLNGEDFVTSGLLLPCTTAVSGSPSVGTDDDVIISGACWIAPPASGSQNGSSNFLLLSLSSKVLLAIGVGWLGVEGPQLAWAASTEQKYISLGAEEETGLILGCTDISGIEILRLNDTAATLATQGLNQTAQQQQDIEDLQEQNKKELKARLAEFWSQHHKERAPPLVKAPTAHGSYRLPSAGAASTLVFLLQQTHVGTPTMQQRWLRTGGPLRLLNSRIVPSAPLLLSDTAGFVWSLRGRSPKPSEKARRSGETQRVDKPDSAEESDGEDRIELECPPALSGISFGGVAGLALAVESGGSNDFSLQMITAYTSGRITQLQVSVKDYGERFKVSARLDASVDLQQSISCLGIIPEEAAWSALEQPQLMQQQQRCLLGFTGGAVGWANITSSNSNILFQLADSPIKSLVGRRLVEAPPMTPLAGTSVGHTAPGTGRPIEPEGTIWAAVCSSGEVVFFGMPEEPEGRANGEGSGGITVLNRLYLTSWLAGQNPDAPCNPVSPEEWKHLLTSGRLRMPEGCGCWLEAVDEVLHEQQQQQQQQREGPFGMFALGFLTTAIGGRMSGIAFFAPQGDSSESFSQPQIRCSRLGLSPLCLSSRGHLLAVGTPSGGVLLFHIQDLLRESCTLAVGFAAAAPAAAPLACISLGGLPLQRVQLLCQDNDRTAAEAACETLDANRTFHLLALGVDGSFHGKQLQPSLLQQLPTQSRLANRAQQKDKITGTWRALGAAPPPLAVSTPSCRCSNTPLLTTTQPRGGPVVAVTCWEPGILQLWILPTAKPKAASKTSSKTPAETSGNGQGVKDMAQAAPLTLQFSCNNQNENDIGVRVFSDTRELYECPPRTLASPRLAKKKSRLSALQRMSLLPTVYGQLESLLREKKDIEHQVSALMNRIAENPALSGLETEAAAIDEDIRLLARQRAEAACNEKQQQQLLLQQAFGAFHKQLMEHVQSITRTPPKELSVAADTPGKAITVSNYFTLNQRPKDRALAKKFLFLRRIQLREDAWLRQFVPSHESMLQMQQTDLTPPLKHFGEKVQGYLIFHQEQATTVQPQLAAPTVGEFDKASIRAAIYAQEPLKGFSSMLQKPLLLATNASRRIQFWVLREVAAELQASFNRRLDECRRGLVRGIEKMQQQASKARKCATQLNGNIGEETGPESSVPSPSDAIKDLDNALAAVLGAPGTADIPGGHKRDRANTQAKPTDAAAQRALNKMMGGKLKTEYPLDALELKADKWEPWMGTVDSGAMTEAQAAKFAAYQEQLRILKEKQDALRAKLQEELKKLRDDITCTARQLRDDLQKLKDWKRVYEEELVLTELAISRLVDSITQEQGAQAADAALRSRLGVCKEQLQQLQGKLQKQQGSCWLLEDERAAAQQNQREKAAALTAALGSGHVPSEALSSINKRLNEAVEAHKAQRLNNQKEESEEPEQALRTECAAVGRSMEKATEALKEALTVGPDGLFHRVLEASRDNIFAQQRLALATEAADAGQQKLAIIKKRLERSQAEETKLLGDVEASSAVLQKIPLDVDLLLRVRKGIVDEIPAKVTESQKTFDFSDSCLVSRAAVDAYKQDIIAGGRQKLRMLEAVKSLRRQLVTAKWRTRLLELEARDVTERTKDVHLLRITKRMQRILQMPGSGGSTASSDGDTRARKGIGSDIPNSHCGSQCPTDRLKEGQGSGTQVQRLEEARAALEKKTAALMAEIRQREAAIKKTEGQLQRVEQNRDFKLRVVSLRRAQEQQTMFSASANKSLVTWDRADEVQVLSRMKAQIRQSIEMINFLRAKLNTLRERNVIFYQDIQ